MTTPSDASSKAARKLSVVVGAQNARASVVACLESILGQLPGHDAEVIVVDGSGDGTAHIVRDQFPGVRLVQCPEHALMPEMWELGISCSEGEIVAITTANCIPREDWIARLLAAHASGVAAVGGAIENDPAAAPADWAVYFCRYSHYTLPFAREEVEDLAGDNASYKRAAIDGCAASRMNGFWENLVHAELNRAGHTLLKTPDVVVVNTRAFTARAFMRQRFTHGREFGRARASNAPSVRRLLRIAAAPAVPAVLLLRIARRIFSRRRHVKELVLSLPFLIIFLSSWTAGETAGYLWPAKAR